MKYKRIRAKSEDGELKSSSPNYFKIDVEPLSKTLRESMPQLGGVGTDLLSNQDEMKMESFLSEAPSRKDSRRSYVHNLIRDERLICYGQNVSTFKLKLIHFLSVSNKETWVASSTGSIGYQHNQNLLSFLKNTYLGTDILNQSQRLIRARWECEFE